MTHQELAEAILKLCDELELLAHYCTDGRHCQGARGFPDLVIVGPAGVIFAELKTQDADTTAEQDRWLYRLEELEDRSCLSADIWRPSDLKMGTIRRALQAIA